ncbi:MAG: photosystem II reaction center protein Psb28 [Chroococcales cyanobacterium]
MTVSTPRIEFFEDLPEELSNVSLRLNKSTGVRSVVLMFNHLRAIEKFNSFRKRFSQTLKLIDSEGTISVEPDGVRFIFGGDEGDEIKRVECEFALYQEDHWERFMRFMERYAEANGMEYQGK